MLVSSCAEDNHPAASSATLDAPSSAATTTPDADDGAMVVSFEDATTPEAQKGQALMQKTRVLEGLAEEITGIFKLPYDIPLVGSQCDEANDFWSPSDQQMVLCYEDITESLNIFADDPDPEATARRVAVASFYHELGHMAIDLYQLPATGREEDVADQLSAYMLLAADADGNVDPDEVQAAKDQAREYRLYAKDDGPEPDDALMADVHTLNQARMYNFECWIYGSNPDSNADIVTDGLLPQDRADGCQDEFAKLTNAWSELLAPHLKQ
ncbi:MULTISPECIES: DUF4344 domain-containing metallopeptidase [unclassified Mycolicibacterium]|uniref:DUF4344 domain-containing metallopeptidase n=1 Tax=unclassified Mycolicibacterium TaxID=2636767 RepID=UPI0012DBDB0C|nr:hypothetical protein [Mycolicibacterium sp. CBMA 329]MUL86466.1 hypothetical protein [Mycolicibacterium sp. CBMA 331]MUM01328.1 hypothetical protein [Mycolicibacterium sp. CBMA 334]MUM25838.1 hypothetical protein [Mycolicibacterium sp. CBMA 295]MUM36762.1 hypothetical protein [Mycolicibacterium sp. CBMA 247]MUM42530.1 hypothetical protein [Mycolicibacterium sp. CBMA 294]